MTKKKTQEEFLDECNKIHTFKYSYNKSIYNGNNKPVIITCPIHGDFTQRPINHLTLKQGCPNCSKTKKRTNTEFITKSLLLHKKKYSYNNCEYINDKEPVLITCPIHGDYKQIPNHHLTGVGCPKCSGKNKSNDEFISECSIVHNNEYDYSCVNYTSSTEYINIICKKHGKFSQQSYVHLAGHKCPSCRKYGYTKDSLTPSFFYIQELKIENDIIGYKYGITNDIKRRMREQSVKSDFTHSLLFYVKDNSIFIYELEKYIKRIFLNIKTIPKSNLENGYTETLYKNDIDLLENSIIDFIINN